MFLGFRLSYVLILSLVFPVLQPCSSQAVPAQASREAQSSSNSRPTIVFMTDFGTANDAVAICRAVIFSNRPAKRAPDGYHSSGHAIFH